MKIRPLFLLALCACVIPVRAEAPKIVNDAPIIVDGPVTVDEGDVLAFLRRIPAEQRGTFRTSYDRIASVADNIFLARSLAQKARAEGLDQDPITQRALRQAQDVVLADAYLAKTREAVRAKDLTVRARELYNVNADDYRIPEQVKLDHILVDLKGRTREQARQRAEDLYKRVTSGKEDFLDLAARYSDDPLKTRNGGAMQYMPTKSLTPATRDAVAKLGKGETTPPFEDDAGFEIYRLVDRKPAQMPAFDEVKDSIMESERLALEKKSDQDLVTQIRSSPTVTIHRENADALVIPVDPEMLRRAQEAAEKKLSQETKPGAAGDAAHPSAASPAKSPEPAKK